MRLRGVLRGMAVGTIFSLLASLLPNAQGNLQAWEKLKKDKFHGTIVAIGPKEMTVKSRENIYLVRTFEYGPEVKKKLSAKKFIPGTRVTVHYYQGTNIAAKLD